MLTEKMFFRINFAEKEATGRIKLDVSATENLRFAKPDYRCLFEAVFSQSAEEAKSFIFSPGPPHLFQKPSSTPPAFLLRKNAAGETNEIEKSRTAPLEKGFGLGA